MSENNKQKNGPKISYVAFHNRQHNIVGVQIGPKVVASDSVLMSINGPFVSCKFASDPGHIHLIPMAGISDICVEDYDL